MAAGEPGGGSEAAATSTASAESTPAGPSNAVDLRQRIDALKAELAQLNSQLEAETTAAPAASSADDPQPQGAAPASAPPAAAPAAQTPPAPMPLPTPSMSGPLSTAVPHEISAGPFGKIQVTGILSGMGMAEDNHVVPGDSSTHADVSNAQVFVQKTTGWFQFYFQGGAYNIPALATPFTQDGPTITGLYGPLPVGYIKLVKGNFNIEAGALPTVVGDEYTFTFENMNVERGLLWGLEPAVSRGVQLNETYKKLTLAFSLNDGFYSNRYTTLSGSVAFAINAANTITFVGDGNAGSNKKNTTATPLLLNNSMVYNLIYTYTKGNLIVSPYYQYTATPKNTSVGIFDSIHTNGGAVLFNYNFKHGFSLALRPEYIKANGSPTDPNALFLLFGPGTGGFSFTATPAWSKDGFFVRGDLSVVHATDLTAGSSFAFGTAGTNANQVRGVIETGFMF